MSSRQVKWIREQLAKKNPHPQQNLEEEDLIDPPTDSSTDFSILKDDSSEISTSIETTIPSVQIILPPPPPSKSKKQKQQTVPEEDETAMLEELALQKQIKMSIPNAPVVPKSPLAGFSIQQLNLVRELKATFGNTQFDECIHVPKSASSLRFMARRKRWPQIANYFQITPVSNASDSFRVSLTEQGESLSQVFTALERANDSEGLMQFLAQSPFAPPILPMGCQSALFQGEFDAATEYAVRGLWILQQSLPTAFVPLKSYLVPSPARHEFLKLILFLARFSFRRGAFQTSNSLMKFGISLTQDDPSDFVLLSAIPALYANDKDFILAMNRSEKSWRSIPIEFIPDWRISEAVLPLPDDILPLAREIAIWPWAFRDDGAQGGEDEEVPELLLSVLRAMRKRLDQFFKKSELEGILETAVLVANDIELDDDRAIAMSYWVGIEDTEFNIADMVEEFAMPTG